MVSDVLLVLVLQSPCWAMVRIVPATGVADALKVIALEMQTTLGLALALPPEK